MAETFLELAPAPARNRVVDPETGFLLSHEWERWYHRLHNWLLVKPSCHVAHSVDQAVTTSTWKTLAFNTEQHDNANMHDVATNNDRITIATDGTYAFGGSGIFETNGTGVRLIQISQNNATPGSGAIAQVGYAAPAGVETYMTIVGTRDLSAGDILRMNVWQDSGGNLDLLSSGVVSPRFWCYRVSG